MNGFNYGVMKGRQALIELEQADIQLDILRIQIKTCEYKAQELFESSELLTQAIIEKDRIIEAKEDIIQIIEQKEKKDKRLRVIERAGWVSLIFLVVIAL